MAKNVAAAAAAAAQASDLLEMDQMAESELERLQKQVSLWQLRLRHRIT